MADYTPNLDDGELWLPSDIFPDEVSAKFSPEFPCELTYMEDLARQLAAYALLERNQNAFRRPRQHSSVAPPRTGFGLGFGGNPTFGVGGRHLYASGNYCFSPGSLPVYQVRPMKPVQPQVEGCVQQPRARVLQSQRQNQVQNSFFPFQVNGSVTGGFVREYGGTGVFLPRIATSADVKKKQNVKNGEEYQQRPSIRKVGLGKQEGFKPPSEMGLPQDWTY
ncbi:PREDICTED: uncharacterized protein LOC104601385 isoform X2 [Nelumbo nucifera]|uniref:Uncharacterized protein LOC104601385 isoform X2 n=1 Tax=Nelumbo nucifera TaxID=4432 RepID=A0A1U8AK89_NELNU|nr:PREDICTED: uncharacterized protein LOC104601385 isoform X2 [Nelumbo nucifera]